MTLQISSIAFTEGDRVPDRFTCSGEDISPPLSWAGVPAGTGSLVLLCDDPDAPAGTWHHWAVFDIAADSNGLDEAYPGDARVGGTRQAVNDFRRTGYGGPCPPPGHGVHHYRFRLLAVSIPGLDLGPSPSCPQVEAAAKPHLLEEAVLVGTYSR
jgi:Raf kinase inhibitor-like YbhB/YbcL family protein